VGLPVMLDLYKQTTGNVNTTIYGTDYVIVTKVHIFTELDMFTSSGEKAERLPY
jgi:hypothetical protein